MVDAGSIWDPAAVVATRSFLAAPEEAQAISPMDVGSFRTILFTDIEGHTMMMQRLGDAKGRDVLREHERLTREALAVHGGAEVKTMGDGFIASFASAQRALECAIALQKAFASREGEPLRIRVGINAGEPIAEDDDLFGSSVIIGARTAAQAKGGEVLVTDVVRQLVAGKGFVFSNRGDNTLRGIEEPVRLYELRWE
jgi:class 3 adenylate cyclase